MKTNNYKNSLLTRFLHYVSFDTQSKPSAKHSPSSAGQMKLAQALQKELIELGLKNVEVSKHAVLTAYLPANRPELSHTIGLIAHLDTSPECSGKNVQPEVIENYRGGDIALGIGEGAELRQSMGVVLIGGLTTSTLLTLVVVPLIYLLFERWKAGHYVEKGE